MFGFDIKGFIVFIKKYRGDLMCCDFENGNDVIFRFGGIGI